MNKYLTPIGISLVALCIVVLAFVMGSMAYQDEVNQEKHYCEMVKSGAWPAFDKSIKCEG